MMRKNSFILSAILATLLISAGLQPVFSATKQSETKHSIAHSISKSIKRKVTKATTMMKGSSQAAETSNDDATSNDNAQAVVKKGDAAGSKFRKLNKKQSTFISTMVPAIHSANSTVLSERQRVTALHEQWQKDHTLSSSNQSTLYEIAAKYKFGDKKFDKEGDWQDLLSRVDIIPTSMVLAQMINESAWGTSRFAENGNNYFGRWCFKPGCGIVPKQRSKGDRHELKRFASAQESIIDYLHNINSNAAYKSLRHTRTQLHDSHKPLNGVTIATGLEKYSSRGKRYVEMIQNVIRKFDLERYNEAS